MYMYTYISGCNSNHARTVALVGYCKAYLIIHVYMYIINVYVQLILYSYMCTYRGQVVQDEFLQSVLSHYTSFTTDRQVKCICVYIYICEYMCVSVFMLTRKCLYLYIYIYIHTQTYIYIYIYMRIYTHLCLYYSANKYVCIYTHICTYLSVRIASASSQVSTYTCCYIFTGIRV